MEPSGFPGTNSPLSDMLNFRVESTNEHPAELLSDLRNMKASPGETVRLFLQREALQVPFWVVSALLLMPSVIGGDLWAQDLPAPELTPRVCIGYNPESKTWGAPIPDSENRYVCPEQYAVFSLRRFRNNAQSAAEVAFLAPCCPLPASDILLADHVWEKSTCPPEHIVTGYQPPRTFFSTSVSQETSLRCTKINTARYTLNDPQPAVHWGISSHAAYPWKEAESILRGHIPVALRYGVERMSATERPLSGCIGRNFNGLLVGKDLGGCRGFRFAALKERLSAREIALAPSCDYLSDIFDPNAECVQFNRQQ